MEYSPRLNTQGGIFETASGHPEFPRIPWGCSPPTLCTLGAVPPNPCIMGTRRPSGPPARENGTAEQDGERGPYCLNICIL